MHIIILIICNYYIVAISVIESEAICWVQMIFNYHNLKVDIEYNLTQTSYMYLHVFACIYLKGTVLALKEHAESH